MARAARALLDRHLLAGGRALHRPAGRRCRAEGTEAGRERALRCSGRGRRRLAGRPVLEHPWLAVRCYGLLLGTPGLGVSGPGAGLAERALPRAPHLARPHAPGDPARPGRERRAAPARDDVRRSRRAPSRCSTARASCTVGTRISAWSNTGAGGWFTSGWRASSRSSPPRSSPSSSPDSGSCRPGSRPRRPCSPPPSTWRAASSGTNHHLYFSGTPTAALAWGATFSALEVVPLVLIGYQAMKDLRISAPGRMGAEVPLADLLLHRGRLLEPGGGGTLRLHDQPADRPLLHAGPQHDARARPRRALRGLRHARSGPHADVPARAPGRTASGRKACCGSPSGR